MNFSSIIVSIFFTLLVCVSSNSEASHGSKNYSLSLKEVRKIALEALNQFNQTRGQDEVQLRVFEGHFPITSQNCSIENRSVVCEFFVIETFLKDEEVYTPNTLHVTKELDTNEINYYVEWGC